MGWMAFAAMAGGQALSSYSAIQGGREAAEMGELQQKMFEGEARAEVIAGAEAAGLKRKEGRALLATQIAQISAGGGGLVGSNLVIMAESAKNVEMDALTIERNAQTRARSLRTRGALARYEGQLARRRARTRAFTGGLGTGGQMYGMYKSS